MRSKPALAIFIAIGFPIVPRPMKPTFLIIDCVPLRYGSHFINGRDGRLRRARKLLDPIGHHPVSWNENFNPASYESPISLARSL
jgi:hypothetical protein